MGEPARVSVDAADPVLEAGIGCTLNGSPELTVVTNGEESDATVVVVDLVDDKVLDVVHSIRNQPHRPEIVLLATELSPGEALHAIAAGAHGLLRRREASANRLSRAVLAAVVGDCTMPPDLIDRVLEQGMENQTPTAPQAWARGGLNEREHAVLRLVAEGYETDEIARRLSYSARTVTAVVHDITQRFRLRNRAHAVAYALRARLL
ncbi:MULTISPECIES: helix-turn-helix transcriptional regulator [Amycolatopsis]|uniref:Helix-turn-helix transcriptional regulator n=1 Tax=Amycolatopsis azurea DSM 43854 TaxID=1238180 RepID=A0ABX3J4Q0_9PSEU|nr:MULTISPECIES: LuxR C-terminal-related transcriptional regulator [Amycolatopsis]OOC02653.1 helix-turn-helix transcriptional regulator [Amycolatopsis azurea DSM 43854]